MSSTEAGGSGTPSDPIPTFPVASDLPALAGGGDSMRRIWATTKKFLNRLFCGHGDLNPATYPDSGFFRNSHGHTIEGGHFSSTSGNTFTMHNVHLHQIVSTRPLNSTELGSAPFATSSSTPLYRPVLNDAVDRMAISFPSMHMGAALSRSASESTYLSAGTGVELATQKDNELYERHLLRKGRGFPLYIPEPNRRLPTTYRRMGVCIGDVGIITQFGGFSFLFNICVPHDHPINPLILPEDFSPIQPSLNAVDIVEFAQFKTGSYLASASIAKTESEPNNNDLYFETSASEGAVLIMPEGAVSLDLENDLTFSEYLKANVQKWYEFVYKIRGRKIANGQIRLVIGCDKTTAWGIATVSNTSDQQQTSKLKFKVLDGPGASSSTTDYTWESSGMAEVRVGPDARETEALRSDGDQPLETKPNNQCLFVRTMNALLSDDDWAKLTQNLGKTTVQDSSTASSGTIFNDPSVATGEFDVVSNHPDTVTPGQGSVQGNTESPNYAAGKESGIVISTIPKPSVRYHPSDHLNQQLLLKFRSCRMVITTDEAWLSTLEGSEGEEIFPNAEQLLEKVLAYHNVHVENGVLRLEARTPGLLRGSKLLSNPEKKLKEVVVSHDLQMENDSFFLDTEWGSPIETDLDQFPTHRQPKLPMINVRPPSPSSHSMSSDIPESPFTPLSSHSFLPDPQKIQIGDNLNASHFLNLSPSSGRKQHGGYFSDGTSRSVSLSSSSFTADRSDIS